MNHSKFKTEVANLTLITKRFVVPAPHLVAAYMRTHSDLLPFLLQAADELNQRFPDSSLELAVFDDPEASDTTELFIYIMTTLPVVEALEKLDHFDEEWFLDTDQQSGHAFNVNLRFA